MSLSTSLLRRLPLPPPTVRVLLLAVLAVGSCSAYMGRTVRRIHDAERKDDPSSHPGSSRRRAPLRVAVDASFIHNMRRLLPILMPAGARSRECGLLAALAAVLVARTWLDIWFSAFNGSVVRAIVSRDKKAFVGRAIVEFGLMMWPLSLVNNSLKLCISALSLSFRSRLTRHANSLYLRRLAFYKIACGAGGLSAPDQLLTQDIGLFSDSLAHLYSNIAKPVVDIFLFAYKLGQAIGGKAPVYMISYFVCSGILLRALSPPFGKYTAMEQSLEGEYRYTHSRIITHSEEIAFYGGAENENAVVNSAYRKVVAHLARVMRLRFTNGIIDSVFVKYLATMLAYNLLASPILYKSRGSSSNIPGSHSLPSSPTSAHASFLSDPAETTRLVEDYQRNSGYLVNLSQAVGRILLAGRDLTRFAGYTARVSELFEVLERESKDEITENSPRHAEQEKILNVQSSSRATSPLPKTERKFDSKSKGTIVYCRDVIKFDSVPIVTPTNEILVESVTFCVEAGMNCLVTGPNGCGKSSLFRILGELWPVRGGTLTKPVSEELFYVPQKPYLALGTLRDQVIYPHNRARANVRDFPDAKISALLKLVKLGYLSEREGGLDAVCDWASALSGGEKQRIAMARLYYHKPQFAILDECTSAVSIDVEDIMYEHARKIGITLFTVSHRTSLFKHHEYLLQFDGQGSYRFIKMNGDHMLPFSFANDKKD